MSEFLANYGFFILIVLFMVICHRGHGAHRGHGRRGEDEGSGRNQPPPPGGGHRH